MHYPEYTQVVEKLQQDARRELRADFDRYSEMVGPQSAYLWLSSQHISQGPDDKWSGRGNDLARAIYEAKSGVLEKLWWTAKMDEVRDSLSAKFQADNPKEA